jgi:hypothetical protein
MKSLERGYSDDVERWWHLAPSCGLGEGLVRGLHKNRCSTVARRATDMHESRES